MADAIAELSAKYNEPPFYYSLCQWGWNQPWMWAPQYSQGWRVDNDIKPWWSSIVGIINNASFVNWATDHYQHGDLDILEVGNNGQGNP